MKTDSCCNLRNWPPIDLVPIAQPVGLLPPCLIDSLAKWLSGAEWRSAPRTSLNYLSVWGVELQTVGSMYLVPESASGRCGAGE